MKRILWLIKGLGRGGAEQLLVSSAHHRDRSRFEYEVAYLLPWKDALVPELASVGVEATCLRGARGLGWVPRLRRLVREGGFDVVHAHSPAVAAVAREALRRGPAFISTEHNVWERYHRATYWANALTFPRNDFAIAVSDRVLQSIRYPKPLRRLPMPPVETLYQGIDLEETLRRATLDGVREELGIPAEAPVVGTIANFKPAKGHQYLIEAASSVLREFPETRFVLIGQGPLESEVRRSVQHAGMADRVLFTGFREDAIRLATCFDIYAASSIYEGLSIALLEVMGLGCPAVVTEAGGFPEVVRDQENGVLVPSADAGALAGAIGDLLRDGDRRAALGRAARGRAADFDIRTTMRKTEEIYGSLA
ncbi:MAG TPA: glycosyltransferase [Actinomycetota bacterium]|jgi:glycosyltransferase involved in cell wall biosynthesis|nr:glycosyltransferase [Actinomycetota bacterium]